MLCLHAPPLSLHQLIVCIFPGNADPLDASEGCIQFNKTLFGTGGALPPSIFYTPVFDLDGNFYVSDFLGSSLSRFDGLTGALDWTYSGPPFNSTLSAPVALNYFTNPVTRAVLAASLDSLWILSQTPTGPDAWEVALPPLDFILPYEVQAANNSVIVYSSLASLTSPDALFGVDIANKKLLWNITSWPGGQRTMTPALGAPVFDFAAPTYLWVVSPAVKTSGESEFPITVLRVDPTTGVELGSVTVSPAGLSVDAFVLAYNYLAIVLYKDATPNVYHLSGISVSDPYVVGHTWDVCSNTIALDPTDYPPALYVAGVSGTACATLSINLFGSATYWESSTIVPRSQSTVFTSLAGSLLTVIDLNEDTHALIRVDKLSA